MAQPAFLRTICFAALLSLCFFTLGCPPGDSDTGSATGGETESGAGAATTDLGPVLDDSEKSMVVVGYSTSYVWPAMLQDMLDEHAGGERIYHVLNAVIGGSPLGRWISAPESEDYQETYGAMLRDFFGPDARLRGDLPAPTVAIIQQSLQRTPTPETRLGPVHDIDDPVGIRIGAESLEKLARQLLDDGIERSYFGMHIYKEGYEPEISNERFALAALLEHGLDFIFAGPDVWSPTAREHPEAFTEDRLHPNERGMRIMAEEWYRALAGDGARQEIIDAMHAREYDVDAMMQEYFDWRREDDGS
jgi:hypothetical protein